MDASDFFSPTYYRRQLPLLSLGRVTPLQHYLAQDPRVALQPHPFFDARYYLERYPDVTKAGIHPLVHFDTWGAEEGRIGFDPFGPDVAAALADLRRPGAQPDAYSAIVLAGFDAADQSAAPALRLIAQLPGDLALTATRQVLTLIRLLVEETGRLDLAERIYRDLEAIDPVEIDLRISDIASAQGRSPAVMDDETEGLSELLVLDNAFPASLSGFRYDEFLAYLKHLPGCRIASSTRSLERIDPTISFAAEAREFSRLHPELGDRVAPIALLGRHRCSVAYTVFLNNAAHLITCNPHLQAKRFVFTLYPGGGLAVGEPAAEATLRYVCADPRLHKIITTQSLTRDYLLDNGLASADRIEHIFGGVIADAWSTPATPHRRDDGPIHVSFAAHRYSEHGIEKGADIFAQLTRVLANHNFRFHFVGDWSPENTGVELSERVSYHGVLDATRLGAHYRQTDCLVSPNISVLELRGRGTFDGFPLTTAVGASLGGAALFLTDSLGLNKRPSGEPTFSPGLEFELIERDAEDIAARLVAYEKDRDALHRLRLRGQAAMLREYSFAKQMQPRIDLLACAMNPSV